MGCSVNESGTGQTNRLLGYPTDARLLIVNADDFGMCHAINTAVIRAFEGGLLRSTTLMTPCPWARHAMRYLSEHPERPFGVHLTAISDFADYRWGPIGPAAQVPSLIDPTGHFLDFERRHALLNQMSLFELEAEFRAQIELVLAAGLRPTHLDWHALRISNRPEVQAVLISLAREYRLALRVYGRVSIDQVRGVGLPCIDYDFLDSYLVAPAQKAERFAQMLRELPEGLSEWAIHPGLADDELVAIEGEDNRYRQSDLDFLISADAQRIVQEEGITLLDYRPLQAVWQAA